MEVLKALAHGPDSKKRAAFIHGKEHRRQERHPLHRALAFHHVRRRRLQPASGRLAKVVDAGAHGPPSVVAQRLLEMFVEGDASPDLAGHQDVRPDGVRDGRQRPLRGDVPADRVVQGISQAVVLVGLGEDGRRGRRPRSRRPCRSGREGGEGGRCRGGGVRRRRDGGEGSRGCRLRRGRCRPRPRGRRSVRRRRRRVVRAATGNKQEDRQRQRRKQEPSSHRHPLPVGRKGPARYTASSSNRPRNCL